MRKDEKTFKEILEDIKKSPFGVVHIEEEHEPKIDLLIEVSLSRYEKLIACEKELELLKSALSLIKSYDLPGVMKAFGFEKKGE